MTTQFRVVEAGISKGWPGRKLARRHARPTRDRVAQAGAEWDGQTRRFCQNEPKNPVATRFFAGDSVRWVRSSAGNRTQTTTCGNPRNRWNSCQPRSENETVPVAGAFCSGLASAVESYWRLA